MQRETEIFLWSNVRGINVTRNPDALPDGLVPALSNVELLHASIGRRRPALQAFTSTGIDEGVYHLHRFISTTGTESIFVFSAQQGVVNELDFVAAGGGAATNVTLTDSPAQFELGVSTAQLNNKLFIACDSSENRLHVWDGTAFRRVGLIKPGIPSVADTGAGAYANTARFYRVSFRIKSGSDIVVESELSDAAEFAPSGGGTAARVTKPTTVDSATHWVVWGLIASAGNTYGLYRELSEIAVGTTIYDDSTNPSAYTGDFPAQLGLHIPPPSARLLLASENRLFMAGSHETSASAGQTVPKTSRVWFTRPLGASDIGDDETIPNTTNQKNWIDVGEGDGDVITALGGPIDGEVYVFKKQSIWRLIPTGDVTFPFIARRVTNAVGAYHSSTFGTFKSVAIVAEDTIGKPCLYFVENEAVYRLAPGIGIERISDDLTPALDGRTFRWNAALFWPKRRLVLFMGAVNGTAAIGVYNPSLAFRDELNVWRGGWSIWPVHQQFEGSLQTACLMTNSSEVVPLLGGVEDAGSGAGQKIIGTIAAANNVAQDADLGSGQASAITATLTSAPLKAGQRGQRHVSAWAPVVDAAATTGATPTLAYVRDYGLESRSVTVPSLAASAASETRVYRRVDGLEIDRARTLQLTYTWDSDQYGVNEMTSAILVPYKVQEPVGVAS